ncbi:hypothetical protein [Dyella sp.]|uniref:hypothetical protein n=1 Tax=Dyella sp. TaxID=1869338 RepID=UPI002FD8D397
MEEQGAQVGGDSSRDPASIAGGASSSVYAGQRVIVQIPASNEKPLSNYEYVFDLFIALGTFVVALLAVFGDRLRAYLARPKLHITTTASLPHVELTSERVSSESSEISVKDQLHLRICITNRGRSIAKASRVVVDCVYKTRDGDPELHKDEILPRVIPWPDDDRPIDLVPNFPYFLEVACVKSEQAEGVSKDAQTISVDRHCLHLSFLRGSQSQSKGEYMKVGLGRVVLPITIFSENIRRPIKYYVSIYWAGSSAKDYGNNSKFDFAVLTVSEAKEKFKEVT